MKKKRPQNNNIALTRHSKSPDDPFANFWDKYINLLTKNKIYHTTIPWYVKHAECYIKAIPDRRLSEHCATDVDDYLRKLALTDWQFQQHIDAIQKLFQLLDVNWLNNVDWQGWQFSLQSIDNNHPTLARETSADKLIHSDDVGNTLTLDDIRSSYSNELTQLCTEIRRRAYSIRTERAYLGWLERFFIFSGGLPTSELNDSHIVRFLEYLAIKNNVAASTQNQALNSLVFFFKHILNRNLERFDDFARAKRPKRLPVVLSRTETNQLLSKMSGLKRLMTALLYGTGMRLMDCLRLRVQDLDFHYHQIVIRNGKGQKDRVVPLPQSLEKGVEYHIN